MFACLVIELTVSDVFHCIVLHNRRLTFDLGKDWWVKFYRSKTDYLLFSKDCEVPILHNDISLVHQLFISVAFVSFDLFADVSMCKQAMMICICCSLRARVDQHRCSVKNRSIVQPWHMKNINSDDAHWQINVDTILMCDISTIGKHSFVLRIFANVLLVDTNRVFLVFLCDYHWTVFVGLSQTLLELFNQEKNNSMDEKDKLRLGSSCTPCAKKEEI